MNSFMESSRGACYEAPKCETLNLQEEGVICGSGYGTTGAPGDSFVINDFGDF